MPLTKAVNLTEEEIIYLISNHGIYLSSDLNASISNPSERLERINYLHKRLKAFKEVEITADTDAVKNDEPKGWG